VIRFWCDDDGAGEAVDSAARAETFPALNASSNAANQKAPD
jgi:hypothetical protein